jgi:repressor LexA
MKKEMNDTQRRILDFVNSQVREVGYPPSVREICKALGIKSTSTVHRHLSKLDDNGYIKKDATKPRAIKIINLDEDRSDWPNRMHTVRKLINIPIVGKVTAGQPILAVENITDTFPLSSEYVKGDTVFMLNVKGDSMIEAGILDGDLILVRKQSDAENGDIVVALIGDEATVKTFYKEKDHVRLQPQNKYMDPIIVKDGVNIIGKVIGLFRKL